MRIFSAESWTKCVNISDCAGKSLDRKLARNSQHCWFAKKVFFIVNLAIFQGNCLLDGLLDFDFLGFGLSLLLILLWFFLFFLLFCWFLSFLLFANVGEYWNLADGLFRFGEGGGYLKHFSGTFTITCSDDWRVYVKEAALLEEFVGGVGQVVANTCYCGDQFSSRA